MRDAEATRLRLTLTLSMSLLDLDRNRGPVTPPFITHMVVHDEVRHAVHLRPRVTPITVALTLACPRDGLDEHDVELVEADEVQDATTEARECVRAKEVIGVGLHCFGVEELGPTSRQNDYSLHAKLHLPT